MMTFTTISGSAFTVSKPALALASFVALSSCSGDTSDLGAFDPLTSQLTNYTVAVALEPETARLRPDGTLTLAAEHPDGRTLSQNFNLVPVPRMDTGPVSATRYFALDVDDADRLAATQAEIADWKAAAPATTGSFSFEASFCDTGEYGPAVMPLVSVWIQSEPGGSFFPVLEEFDPANADLPIVSGPCPV